MLKRLIKKLLVKAYMAAKIDYEIKQAADRKTFLESVAVIHPESIIGEDMIIQNSTGDRTRISIGARSWVRGHLMVFAHGGKVTIGEDCFIGPDTKIWSAIDIRIGNRVLISHNVNIHDNNSHPLDSKERHEDFQHIFKAGLRVENNLMEKEVIIEDDAWVGFNSTILKGVRIGKGAIIGSNSIITKDVPPYAIVVGKSQSEIIRYTT
ncbi:MAG: acyltransferase [Bacteroidetes bacterium]|nr:acyltransferase [Bacteroidota bacterium]